MFGFCIGQKDYFWYSLVGLIVNFKTVGCCNWTDSVLKNTSIKIQDSGLHRRFLMDISFEGQNRFIECQTAFRLTIPSGAYIDMDSLEQSAAFIIGNVKFDVELPERVSIPVSVYIFSKKVLRKTFVFEQRIEFPIHLRYHQAQLKTEKAIVNFESPSIILRCEDNKTFYNDADCKKHLIEAPCNEATADLCRWINLGTGSSQSVKVAVPVGALQHTDFVFAVTFLVVAGCVNAIVFFSYWSS